MHCEQHLFCVCSSFGRQTQPRATISFVATVRSRCNFSNVCVCVRVSELLSSWRHHAVRIHIPATSIWLCISLLFSYQIAVFVWQQTFSLPALIQFISVRCTLIPIYLEAQRIYRSGPGCVRLLHYYCRLLVVVVCMHCICIECAIGWFLEAARRRKAWSRRKTEKYETRFSSIHEYGNNFPPSTSDAF